MQHVQPTCYPRAVLRSELFTQVYILYAKGGAAAPDKFAFWKRERKTVLRRRGWRPQCCEASRCGCAIPPLQTKTSFTRARSSAKTKRMCVTHGRPVAQRAASVHSRGSATCHACSLADRILTPCCAYLAQVTVASLSDSSSTRVWPRELILEVRAHSRTRSALCRNAPLCKISTCEGCE
jgi:hypothetical protein